MEKRLHFAPIGSAAARSIHRLQKRAFPPELRENIDEITALLKKTEAHFVCNLSFGVFDGSRMVGYLFAYVEEKSLFHERNEDVIYIKEIALLPGYEVGLRRLFTKLFEQWSAFTPNVPVEAHVLEDSLRSWKRMARLFRYYGLSVSTRPERPQADRPPYLLLRLDVDPATAKLADTPSALPGQGWSYDNKVSVSVITKPRQWLTLKSEWNSLLSDTQDSNVFQSFDYLWLWWRFHGIWHDLRVILIRRGGAVIGVVPMMAEHFSVIGKTVRKLMFISAPMEMSRPKLIFGDNDAECIPAFFAYLASAEEEWDIIDIDEQIHSRQTDNIRKELESRQYLVAESETVCPYIEIEGDWQTFIASRSKKMRGNINRLRRRLSALGKVETRLERHWPQLDQAMAEYCEIEDRSWKAEKTLDIASSKESYFFYFALAEAFGRSGNFEMRILECGGKALAGTFGIVDNGIFQSLKIAHDQNYDRYSPGTVLESYELQGIFESGVKRYEFMGSFLANKLRWTSTVHTTSNLHIYQRQLRLLGFFFFYFVFKRHMKKLLMKIGLFDNFDRFLKKFPNNPFIRY